MKKKQLIKNVRCSANKNNAITTTTKILQYVFSRVYWCNNSNNDFCNRLHIVYSIAVSYYLVIFTLILQICIMKIIAKVPLTCNYDNTEIQIQYSVHSYCSVLYALAFFTSHFHIIFMQNRIKFLMIYINFCLVSF